MKIAYTPSFLRQINQLESSLRGEVIYKIELFRNIANHKHFNVHKLRGRLAGRWSFSVNYKWRIVFLRFSKNEVILLAIGNHDVYDK